MRSAMGLLLAVLCACGGGGSAGAVLTDLTGTWSFYRTDGGIDDDPLHMTVVQSGTVVEFERTCNGAWPLGTGSFASGVLALTFDLGGGESAGPHWRSRRSRVDRQLQLGAQTGTWRMERTALVLDCAHACDPIVPLPFVDTDFTDLVEGRADLVAALRRRARLRRARANTAAA